jgi:hypothetical protein
VHPKLQQIFWGPLVILRFVLPVKYPPQKKSKGIKLFFSDIRYIRLSTLGEDSNHVGMHVVERPWQAGNEVEPETSWRLEIQESNLLEFVTVCIRDIQSASEKLTENF